MKKLTVAGIGAGSYEGLTVAAVRALEAADVIVGYTVYCDLMKPYFPDKEWISTPMMKEIERCRLALEKAEEGKNTVMICSGDAGIYGMASPVLEMAGEYDADIEIIAGVTAAVKQPLSVLAAGINVNAHRCNSGGLFFYLVENGTEVW